MYEVVVPAHVAGLSPELKRKWVHLYNSAEATPLEAGPATALADRIILKEVPEFTPADPIAALALSDELVDLATKSYQYVDSWEYQSRQISQEQAQYNAVGGTNTNACSNCMFFVSPARCTVVSGEIAPNGLSNQWKAITPFVQEPIEVRIVKETTEPGKPTTPAVKDGVEVLVEAGAFRKKGLRDKVAEALGSFLGMKSSVGETEGFFLQKQSDGSLRWYTRYSNSWQDRDGEIVTQASHKEYVDWATETNFYPELWVWHADGSRLGQADWLDYSDGFAHASGTIDPGSEPIVMSLAGKELGVSHGMFSAQVGKYVTKHRTFEISVLPRERASVWTTDFGIIGKETELMGFTPARRTFLVEAFGEDKVKAMEENTDKFGTQLKALGVEFKETEETPPPTPQAGAASNEMLAAIAQQTAETSAIVMKMVDGFTALKAEVAEKTKTVEEQVDAKVDDAWMANFHRAIKEVGFRPTESAPIEAVLPAASSEDFLGSLIADQLGLAAKATGVAGGIGTAAPAAARIQ